MDDDDGLTGTLGGSGDAAAGVTKSEPPAPPREEMVANAVAFLRHPQVATSPEHSKRAFLEKKGLTEPEIAEAFRRVPQDKKADAADGADAKTRANDAKGPKGASKEQGLRWTQVVARAGAAVAAVSWAYKTLRPKSDSDAPGATSTRVPPPLPSAGASDASTASASAERTAAALAQAVAAAEAAKRDAADARARAAAAERALEAAPPPPSLTADDVSTAVEAAKRDLRRELESVVARAVRDATRESENVDCRPLGSLATPEGVAPVGQPPDAASAGVRRELAAIKAMLASSPLVAANAGVKSPRDDRTPRMRADAGASPGDAFGSETETEEDELGVGSSGPDVVVPPSAAKSRAALAGSSRAARAAGPGPATPTRGAFGAPYSGTRGGDFTARPHAVDASPPSTPADPPHPASYRDVLDMLDKGLTPPGIKDVDDKPPDPTRSMPRARVEPRRKPWEASLGTDDDTFDEKKPFPMGRRRGDENVFENVEDEDAAGGWRPPRVPSMSSEASEVLFGTKTKKRASTSVTDERVDKSSGSFAGFETPGEPSGSFAG